MTYARAISVPGRKRRQAKGLSGSLGFGDRLCAPGLPEGGIVPEQPMRTLLAPACVGLLLLAGLTTPARSAEFEAFHRVPSPTRTSVPQVMAEPDPMRALAWLEGTWKVSGNGQGGAEEGRHAYSFAYGGKVLFVHETLLRAECHGAIASDAATGNYSLISSHANGDLRVWSAKRTGSQMLVFLSNGALNRAGAGALRWTIRRNLENRYDSYLDAVPPAPKNSGTVLSGRLAPPGRSGG